MPRALELVQRPGLERALLEIPCQAEDPQLIRKFNEALNENPGEPFTPRDVVHLMVDLMLAGDEKAAR